MPKEKSPTASKKNVWGSPIHHPILGLINPKNQPLWPCEPCPNTIQSRQLLNLLTPLLWHNISHAKPAPTWKITSSTDKSQQYLYLSLTNPLLSVLDSHPWFQLQTFITEDSIWQGRLSKSERKAITLHTILNCPAPSFPHKTLSFESLDAFIERLIAEREQRLKQDKLLKEEKKKRPEKKLFCWWENLPFEVSALFMEMRNQLALSPDNAVFNTFFSPLQSAENPKSTLGLLVCQGSNVLLVIANPKPHTLYTACLSTARKYKLVCQFSAHTLQQAQMDCSALALTAPTAKDGVVPAPGLDTKNHTNHITLLALPEQQTRITQLLAYCLPSPLCETPCKLIPHSQTKHLAVIHDTFPHPLVVDDNLLNLLHRRKSLQRMLLTQEHQPDISHFPTIILTLPKLDKPSALYPIEQVHFRITLYGNPTTTKSLLIKTFASLENLILPHSQADWVTCLHYWPEYLDDIKPHIPLNTTAYQDCLLVEALLPQLLYRHPICKKTRIQLPKGLESAWEITNQLLQYPKKTPLMSNTSQHRHYPDKKLAPHRHLLQDLLTQNPPLQVTPLTSEPGSVLLTNQEQQLLANYWLSQPIEPSKKPSQPDIPPSPIFATEDWQHTPENSFSSTITSDSDEDSLHETSLSYEYSRSDDATWKSVPGLDECLTLMADYFNQNTLVAEVSQCHVLSVTRSPSPKKTANPSDKHNFFATLNHKLQPKQPVLQKNTPACKEPKP